MDSTSVDVVVVGLGPGGEHVATELATGGLEVVGLDRRLVGGECPYYGCIPSKMMLRAAETLAEARRVDGLAGTATTAPDWAPVADRIRDEATTDWDDQVAVDRLTAAGVRFLRAEGRIVEPGVVEADGQRFLARRGVVLNTGTEPAVPPIDGLAGTPYWTNREAVRVTELPESLAVVGGGPIGVELAQAFARFGVTVTVLEAAGSLLPADEPEAGRLLADALESEGIAVRTSAEITSVSHDGRFRLTASGDPIEVERLLVATGRRPNLSGIGLEHYGLDPDARSVTADEWLRAADGLWAVGDIVGKGAFTHISMYHAGIVARDLLGRAGPPADHRAVPRVTFTDPEVAGVGLTEAQARAAGRAVRVGRSSDLGSRGWLARRDGLVKLVADGDELVGATVGGPGAGEIIAMLVTALHAHVPVSTLRSMVLGFPTFHRAVGTALEDLG